MIIIAIKNKTYTGEKQGMFTRKVAIEPYLRVVNSDNLTTVQVISDVNSLSCDKNIALARAGHKTKREITSRYKDIDIADADVFFSIEDMSKLPENQDLDLLVMPTKDNEQALNGHMEFIVIDTDKEEVICRKRADATNRKAGQQVGYRVFFGRKGNGLEISYIAETTSHKLYYSDNIA